MVNTSYSPLSLHPDNPHYFLFRGKPTVLITSGEHYGSVINLDFDYTIYLDELHQAGLNHTRLFAGVYRELPDSFSIQENTLGPLPGRYAGPYASSTPGAQDGHNPFDLDSWNQVFFNRLVDFIQKASQHGIVVEVTLFCPYYVSNTPFGIHHWEMSPWHPANNINGIGVGIDPCEIHTLKHPALLVYQEKLVQKIVREVNGFDNLYFEICNEPYFDGITLEWQHHIANTIVETEQSLPFKHLISQNVANFQKKVQDADPAVAIFNFHYARPPRTVVMNYGLNRVIGNNETGFDGPEDAVYRSQAWEFILAGGALFNNLDYSFTAGRERGTLVCMEEHAGGGSAALRRQYHILMEFIEGFDFIHMVPDNAILKDAGDVDAATVLAEHGRAYAVYVRTRLRRASLEFHLPAGSYRAEWVSTTSGVVEKSEAITHGGGFVRLDSPRFREDIALRIKADTSLNYLFPANQERI